MKRILSALALFVMLALPAFAGDMDSPGSPVPPPPPCPTCSQSQGAAANAMLDVLRIVIP